MGLADALMQPDGLDPELLKQIMGLGSVDQRYKMLQEQAARGAQTAEGVPIDYRHGKGAPLALASLANLISSGVGGYQEGKAVSGQRDLLGQAALARSGFSKALADASQPTPDAAAPGAPAGFVGPPAPGNDYGSVEGKRHDLLASLRSAGLLSGDKTITGMVKSGPSLALADQKVAAGQREADAATSPATGVAFRGLLRRFGVSAPEDTPNAALEKLAGIAEKGYGAEQSAKARVAASGAGAVGDNAQTIGDAIISGEQSPDLKGMYRMGPAIRAYLAKKGYDLAKAQQEWQATSKHLSTMNGTQQERLRQAVDFTSHSLETIEKLYEDWRAVGLTSGVRIFNRAALTASKNLPGDAGAAATALEAQINDLTAELGNVYMGGNSPTDHALKLAGQNLSAEWNEQTFKKALDLARTNLRLRSNAMRTATAGGSRYDVPAVPAPAAAGGQDAEAVAWAKAHPDDPRAAKILEANK